MRDPTLSFAEILEARKAFREGKNVTQLLRERQNVSHNTKQIIEIAYDLQAGNYIEQSFGAKQQAHRAYSLEIASTVNKFVNDGETLLDVGTGELTTLCRIVNEITCDLRTIYAFDISWSRIYKGAAHAARELSAKDWSKTKPFVAEIGEIPLPDKSVDVTLTCHALEPNGDRPDALIRELFRVTRKRVLMFEPHYEIASQAVQARMDSLGYVKGLETSIRQEGGRLTETFPLKNSMNELNPTSCFVIEPTGLSEELRLLNEEGSYQYSVPGSNIPLFPVENFLFSPDTGFCFAILQSIPILRANSAILASSLSDLMEHP